jgi:hypothetical protein
VFFNAAVGFPARRLDITGSPGGGLIDIGLGLRGRLLDAARDG